MFFWIIASVMVVFIAIVIFGESCYKKWRKERDKYDYEWHYSSEERQRRAERREEIDKSWYGKIGDFWCDNCTPFQVIMGVLIAIVAIMLIILAVTYGTAPGDETKYQTRYEVLTYEYQNAIFEKDSDVVGNKMLYDEIREYNETIAVGKTYVDDVWWGIFWPDFYEDLPLIEFE